jgi:hypothetical protein
LFGLDSRSPPATNHTAGHAKHSYAGKGRINAMELLGQIVGGIILLFTGGGLATLLQLVWKKQADDDENTNKRWKELYQEAVRREDAKDKQIKIEQAERTAQVDKLRETIDKLKERFTEVLTESIKSKS